MSADTNSERKHADYLFYKKHGYCVNCHHNPAEPGKTLCLECLMDKRARDRERVRSRESLDLHKAYCARRREKARAAGLCIMCCKRSAAPGKSCCEHCLALSRERQRSKRAQAGLNQRSLMGKDGTCYFCGNPEGSHAGLCDACYERCRAAMLYARSFRSSLPNNFELMCKHSYELNHLP